MRWTERQRAMLREMGVVLAPERPAGEPPAADATAALATARATAPAAGATAAAAVAERAAVVRARTEAPRADAAPARSRDASAPAAPRSAPVGSAAGQWLVVGDALDAAAGEESVLLDNMLRAVGIARSGSTATTPSARFVEIASWPAVAADEPAACVLVLGRAAAEAVLGSADPLGTLRGRLHAWQGRPVVVTFSLAYLLRHPADKAKAWADLCLAVQAAGSTAANAA